MTIKEKKDKLSKYCAQFSGCDNGCKLVDYPCYLQTDEEIEKQYEIVFGEEEKKTECEFKYNVGDKVRVLDYNKVSALSKEMLHPSDMNQFVGKEYVINMRCVGGDNTPRYKLNSIFDWYFDENWLTKNKFSVGDIVVGKKSANEEYTITKEGWKGEVISVLDEERIEVKSLKDHLGFFTVLSKHFDKDNCILRIEITSDGKETTAIQYDKDKVIAKAKAKCSPEDEFDFMTGAKLALERLAPTYEEGDLVLVKKDESGHGFPINSVVKLIKQVGSRNWRAKGYSISGYKIDTWYITEKEFEKYEEE